MLKSPEKGCHDARYDGWKRSEAEEEDLVPYSGSQLPQRCLDA